MLRTAQRLTRTIGAALALFFAVPLLTGCERDEMRSAGSIAAKAAAPTAVQICATARAGLTATPARARAASMQCLIAAETAYQSAAMLALPFVSNGTIKTPAVARLRTLNTEIVRQLSAAYNATSSEQRVDLADAIGHATAEILRIILERDQ